MERDFEIGTRKFKLSKINAFKQFHIVRRIAPILAELLPAVQLSKAKEGASESEKLEELSKMATPMMMGLSKLSDEDANYVLFGLLSAVELQQEKGNWARVATESAGLMIQDLELPEMIQIAGKAFMYNLSGFFGALPQVK